MIKPSNQNLLPRWFSVVLFVAITFSALIVSTLAYWTVEAVLEAPLNPLDGGGGVQSLPTLASVLINESTPTPVSPAEATYQFDVEPIGSVVPQEELPSLSQLSVTQTVASINQSVAQSKRNTILVMGIDRRPGEPFISRTDTMMLLSVDPEDQTASMMSIPRDFYALIPNGYGYNRINTAFLFGASNGAGPAGGAALAMDAVSLNLGVHIDHYLLVDFAAFINAVDAIGGIDVNVPTYIYDPLYPDMNYGYELLEVPAGLNHFDGEMALKYARTRHTDNDFGRAARQQQVILAMRDQALALGANDLLFQLPFLYNQLEEGIKTDLSISEMMTLAKIAATIPSENIESVVLDYNYFVSYNANGADVLVLQNAAVAPVINRLFRD